MEATAIEQANILAYKIIGCAIEVHRVMGNGFQELIYQRALAFEFERQEVRFIREQAIPLFYKGDAVGERRVDFIVEDYFLVEIKAVLTLEDVHLAQIKNYLTAYQLPTGLLINFGAQTLEKKRVFPFSSPYKPQ